MKNTVVVREVVRGLTGKDFVLNVKITGIIKFKVRLFLAVQLIKLAVWIIGCGVQFEVNMND